LSGPPVREKLYCYVDETGQDTAGEIFIVSIVLTGTERDNLLRFCKTLEDSTGKGNRKWHKTNHQTRLEYLRRILAEFKHEGILCYSIFRGISNYDEATMRAIAEAISTRKPAKKYTTLIYVDALPKSKRFQYGRGLRRRGIPARKVQGVTREESNALIRLADTVAGFVRDVIREEAGEEAKRLFDKAKRKGILVEV
jgi:hypothetical protein